MTEKSCVLTVFATVYNVAEYLPLFFRCMERQTYKDYILLIIDDGSGDNSLEICRDYAKKDPRIDVIHIEHVGTAAARNYAISMIRTPFTASVDGDDVYEPDYLRHLVEAQKKYDADLVISRLVYRSETYVKIRETKASGELFIPRERFKEMLPILLEDCRLNYLYAKLFRSNILKTTHVEDDVKRGSDTMFCCQYVTKANSIVLIDDLDTNYIRYVSRFVTFHHNNDAFQIYCRIENVNTEVFRNSGFLTDRMQQAIDKRVLKSALWALSYILKDRAPVNNKMNRIYNIVRSPAFIEAICRQNKNLCRWLFLVIKNKR